MGEMLRLLFYDVTAEICNSWCLRVSVCSQLGDQPYTQDSQNEQLTRRQLAPWQLCRRKSTGRQSSNRKVTGGKLQQRWPRKLERITERKYAFRNMGRRCKYSAYKNCLCSTQGHFLIVPSSSVKQ